MRSTIRFDDQLLIQAKKLAAERGTTLSALLEDALRETLARRKPPQRRLKLHLTTTGRGGVQPHVDLDDTAALLDRMEGRDGVRSG
jgi:predicted transcriptional regulator